MLYLQPKDNLNDVLGRIIVLGKRFSIVDLNGDTLHKQGSNNERKKMTLEFTDYKGMADRQGETVKHTICKPSKTETCI